MTACIAKAQRHVYGVVATSPAIWRVCRRGMENRPCEIFIKPTRGDLNTLPDAGLDSFTVKAIYRPAWIFRP